MKIKVNNYCKGKYSQQLERLFDLISSSSNNHVYQLKAEYEYKGKNGGYHKFGSPSSRIAEAQILCIIIL